MCKRSRGFTLIESVIVIVMVGILVAFALPRFTNLNTEAKEAIVNSVAASLHSASALAHGIIMVEDVAADATISMEGNPVAMLNNYPAGTNAGIVAALPPLPGVAMRAVGTTAILFWPSAVKTSANCNVKYTGATSITSPPAITVTTSDCT